MDKARRSSWNRFGPLDSSNMTRNDHFAPRICSTEQILPNSSSLRSQNLTIWMLTLGVFLTATSELTVSGVISQIAGDFGITLGLAGQLVTVFSLAYAIGTPLLISLTSRWDRKKLLLYAQLAFIAGCLVAWVSPNIAVLMISRVILGASSGVFLVVSFAAAAKIIAPYKIGSAISTLVLGFSLSMILGVPIGIAIADWLNWKAIFLLLGLISAGVAWLITKLLPPIEGDAPVPYFQQFKVLGSNPHDCGRANCTNRGFDRFTFHGGSGFSWDWLYRFDGCSHVYDRAGDPKLFYSTFA